MPLNSQKPLQNLDAAAVVHETVPTVPYLHSTSEKPKPQYLDSFVHLFGF